MQLSDFHYELPSELIARYPLPERSASRLLSLDSKSGVITHGHFPDFLNHLTSKDLLVFNNTRVIPARLFGVKESGGKVEVMLERVISDDCILAQVRASKTPRVGSRLLLSEVSFIVVERREDLFLLRCDDERSVLTVIEAMGQIPIPPYFQRQPDANDNERYQTIYADPKGSVAAPTAGLHFDAGIFKRLQELQIETAYLTLHVGAGTFAPVRVENISEHRMHAEVAMVSPELCAQVKKTKARGGRVIAVGTTSARSLETASRSEEIQPFNGDTDIFIYPGFKFNCVDALITNFHLPSSTLLMLVSAFGGYSQVMAAYQEAIRQQYRFYSYGDAMWVERLI